MTRNFEFELALVGINHKTAPLRLRNRLALTAEEIASILGSFKQNSGFSGIAILSTCNRTEWHCHAERGRFEVFLENLRQQHDLHEMEEILYVYHGENAIRHFIRVASGLDSMVLGEAQILGQVKQAYGLAKDFGTLSPLLEKLFQLVLNTAKRIRSETELGTNPISIAYAAVTLAKRIFEDIRRTRVLLIGAGDTISRVAHHLRGQAVSEIIIANRHLDRACALADEVGGQAILLTDIPQAMASADIVFSATTSTLPILGKGLVERVLKQGKHRPLFMVDLAVPRDIEPEVAEIPDVYLYTIDDLEQLVEKNREARQQAAAKAEHMLEKEVEFILNNLRVRNVAQVIQQYRGQMEQIRDKTVQEALMRLDKGLPAEAVVKELGRTLTNKLIHKPCATLRQASYKDPEGLFNAALKLLETA